LLHFPSRESNALKFLGLEKDVLEPVAAAGAGHALFFIECCRDSDADHKPLEHGHMVWSRQNCSVMYSVSQTEQAFDCRLPRSLTRCLEAANRRGFVTIGELFRNVQTDVLGLAERYVLAVRRTHEADIFRLRQALAARDANVAQWLDRLAKFQQNVLDWAAHDAKSGAKSVIALEGGGPMAPPPPPPDPLATALAHEETSKRGLAQSRRERKQAQAALTKAETMASPNAAPINIEAKSARTWLFRRPIRLTAHPIAEAAAEPQPLPVQDVGGYVEGARLSMADVRRELEQTVKARSPADGKECLLLWPHMVVGVVANFGANGAVFHAPGGCPSHWRFKILLADALAEGRIPCTKCYARWAPLDLDNQIWPWLCQL
jgi:hypothetical protein